MPQSLKQVNPDEAWLPAPPKRWDLKWAAHLYRRAAFGFPPRAEGQSSWQALGQAVAAGRDASLEALLDGGRGKEDFDHLMDQLGPRIGYGRFSPDEPGSLAKLQGWWMYRMIYTPHPLRERITLFWHNHFATSVAKVRQLDLMLLQNGTLRAHALGKFQPFLLAMSRDPAMLLWLDSNSNIKGRPNENYARELMELFSMGVGNYTEKDIQEAARAFTGWQANGEEFYFNAPQHDDGQKSVLGQSGALGGQDIVRIVLEQPAAARFVVRKLFRELVNEFAAPSDELLEPLADRLRGSGYDIRDCVRTILRSRLFFSEHAYRQRIKSPVEFVVGLVRGFDGRVEMGTLAGAMDGLGQSLFQPPNVKGWDGGKTWLNSATLVARHNLAWRLLGGQDYRFRQRINPAATVTKHQPKDAGRQAGFLLDLLLQGDVSKTAKDKLAKFATNGKADEKRLRELAHTVVLMPEYQLS